MYLLLASPKIQTDWNSLNPSTDKVLHVARVPQVIVGVDSLVLGGPECAPKSKSCKHFANHVQTKTCGCVVYMPVEKGSMCTWRKVPCVHVNLCKCPASTEQAVPDPTSPRVYHFSRGAGAHLSGLNKLFFGYLILSESVFGPVLPLP